ncbi:MAG: calcium/sodium antiporter [Candidatus Acidoferrales bacterium]
MHLLGLLAGLAALYLGAEWLVRGAARLAASLGVRPLVIGITVVGFATSMPEVVVSTLAAFRGQTDTALGNIIGSSIANPGLILGIAALLSPLRSDLGLLKREGPVMVGVTVLVCGLAWTGVYTRWQGALLLAGLMVFLWFSLRWARREPPAVEAEFERLEARRRLLLQEPRARQVRLIVVGLVLLGVGGHLLVTSALALARRFGISEMVIAASLVAVGTSLPELATSIVAAARRQTDISVGNIIGSNIFNLLGVLGISALVRPIPVSVSVRNFEMVWLLGFAAATLLVLRTGHRISRFEGAALLTAYAAFLFFLFR